ncbi:glycoside hydrolase family 31 protein [Trichocladium antarcticum]|uniref:alpha-glucosidase n=1 Tax=Trichocladium antarcticum TaxID=1450529 RepID=A0AAN6ZB37_9PEZI|nr:glycoside hydrolase family 31 protein [Trichocladium antarcticum]
MAPTFLPLALLAVAVLGRVFRPASQCPGYRATNVLRGDSYLVADLRLIGNCESYSNDINDLRLLVEYQTESRLHVLIEDADNQVYQVQEQVLPRPKSQNASAGSSALKFSFTENPFTFSVTRASTGEVLFDTSDSPLIFQSQYLQLRTSLPRSPNIYGLGEHSDDFRLPTDNYTRTLWNAESPFIPNRQNLYGSHPVYFDHRGASGTHGVFLLSASGMDIRLSQTDSGRKYLEYNTIGGVFDFYFLAGPEPASVSKQYAEVVGFPAMQQYWTLGFHQCKYGWPTIDHVAQVVANYSAAGIPLETVWGDIDYMHGKRDFTSDPVRYPIDKVRALVDTLHRNNQHYVQILDPGIRNTPGYGPYDRGAEQGAFIRAADGSFYRGLQWPGEVVWPDWFAPGTQDWWTNEIRTFYSPTSGIPVDGLWVDMNEASNMCADTTCPASAPPGPPTQASHRTTAGHTTSSPPHLGLPGRDLLHPAYPLANHHGALSARTLATNLTNADGTTQYDTHNLYGTSMALATHAALQHLHPAKRPFVLTRSTSPGAGRAAAHWFGDNTSSWAHYRAAIRQMLASGALHAQPLAGSDVCGFNGQAGPRLCARWAVLGAWQPFYRNHADAGSGDQEFYRWADVAAAARRAVAVRYRLLDYLYTALWRASGDGGGGLVVVVSPVWFAYPADEATWGVQTQWFLGAALLVSPVVEDESQRVEFYLPQDVWYDFWTGEMVRGGVKVVDGVGWGDIPVHIRGGSIVPMRVRSANTTAETRRENFAITVAPGMDGTARGELYLDDGESRDVGSNKSMIRFAWDGESFVANGTFGYRTHVVVESVLVLGQAGGKGKTHRGPWGLNEAFGFRL